MAEKEDSLIAKQDEVLKYLTSVMRSKSKSSVLAMAGDGVQEIIEKPPDKKERTKAAELLGKRYRLFTDNQDKPKLKGVEWYVWKWKRSSKSV